MTVRQRVLNILVLAMNEGKIGTMYVEGELVSCPDGWVSQWVFASIHLCGSTEGKRRLRELREDEELQKKYVFEQKHEGQKWYYRIRKREPAQLKMALAECQEDQSAYC